jgi:hypothetical protein
MKWSVGIKADGDREMSHEAILDLADSVAKHNGIASGIGQTNYGAKIIVDAVTKAEAEAKAKEHFRDCVREAKLPEWPITWVETFSEEDEEDEW